MIANFLTVSQLVIVLFILMGLGVIGNKKGLLNATSISGMTNVVLYFVTPCVILNSFQREPNGELMKGLLITATLSLVIHTFAILLARVVFRNSNDPDEIIYRFAVVFSNCGFMSLPIEEALLGDIGVFYGSVYIAIFNVVLWTYGLTVMSGNVKNVNIKQLVLNPGILGTVLGIIVFAFGIHIPSIISSPIGYMAALNTPLPMIIIGYYLGNLHFSDLRTDKKQYLSIFLRLIVVPLISIALMYFIKVDKTIFTVCTLASCAPTAAVTTMFANRYNRNAALGARMVSVSTLFSLITIPLLVALATSIAQ